MHDPNEYFNQDFLNWIKKIDNEAKKRLHKKLRD